MAKRNKETVKRKRMERRIAAKSKAKAFNIKKNNIKRIRKSNKEGEVECTEQPKCKVQKVKLALKVVAALLLAVLIGILAIIVLIAVPYYKNQIEVVEKVGLENKALELITLNSGNSSKSTPRNRGYLIDTDKPFYWVRPNNSFMTGGKIKGIVSFKDSTFNKENLSKKYSIYKKDKLSGDIVNILLCGLDARDYSDYSRSDTIILASYNSKEHTIKMVSFMRDSWVNIPDFGWSRINAATAFGGTGLLINTLNENFGLDIQNYVQIKFDDFKKVIDILGGIDIELSQSEIDYINRKQHEDDWTYSNDILDKPGVVHLNGAQALWHCRNRSIGNSDFTRTERQREVLSILIEKLKTMSITQATQLVISMKDCVNTNVPLDIMLSLAIEAVMADKLSIETSRIPFDGMFRFANKNGASVLDLSLVDTTKKLHEFLGYTYTDKELEDILGKISDSPDGNTTNTYTPYTNVVTTPIPSVSPRPTAEPSAAPSFEPTLGPTFEPGVEPTPGSNDTDTEIPTQTPEASVISTPEEEESAGNKNAIKEQN